jgi:hypothetical protein
MASMLNFTKTNWELVKSDIKSMFDKFYARNLDIFFDTNIVGKGSLLCHFLLIMDGIFTMGSTYYTLIEYQCRIASLL